MKRLILGILLLFATQGLSNKDYLLVIFPTLQVRIFPTYNSSNPWICMAPLNGDLDKLGPNKFSIKNLDQRGFPPIWSFTSLDFHYSAPKNQLFKAFAGDIYLDGIELSYERIQQEASQQTEGRRRLLRPDTTAKLIEQLEQKKNGQFYELFDLARRFIKNHLSISQEEQELILGYFVEYPQACKVLVKLLSKNRIES